MVVTESLGYSLVAARAGAGISVDDFTGLTTTAGFQMGTAPRTETGFADFADVVAAAEEGAVRFGVMSPKLADLAYLLGRVNGVVFNIVEVASGRAVMDGVSAGEIDLGFMAAMGIALGFGVLGYLVRRLGISLLPFVIAFILGPRLEETARQAFAATGADPWFLFSSWTGTALTLLARAVPVLALRRRATGASE